MQAAPDEAEAELSVERSFVEKAGLDLNHNFIIFV